LEDSEINAFYSSLNLFAYISEYEGFGFPPLEALKCGTPSLLLESSSLKEIYQDIAIFIDNPKKETIKNSILNYFRNEDENKKSILNKFKEKENYFKWERAAREYLLEIKKIVNRG